MSRRRPGISRSHGKLGWMSKHLDVSAGPATTATCQPVPSPAIVRVHHPAIKAPEYKCYRVLRRFLLDKEMAFEDIGAFKGLSAALILSSREQGFAVVLDPNGKQVSWNGQPIAEHL